MSIRTIAASGATLVLVVVSLLAASYLRGGQSGSRPRSRFESAPALKPQALAETSTNSDRVMVTLTPLTLGGDPGSNYC